MPRIPKGEPYLPKKRIAAAFPPVPEETIRKDKPYFQTNTGFFKREFSIGQETRTYGVYVPEGLMSKGDALLLFPESNTTAEEFLEKGSWKELAERYHTALMLLESEKWQRDETDTVFDYAWGVVLREFGERLTADICESCIYPMGFGDGAWAAAAFAVTYSASFPAFAADGDCFVEKELLDILRSLPSDGIDTKKKTEIAMPGFVIDRGGRAAELVSYLKETLHTEEEGLCNDYGSVYLEKPRAGAYFVNEQPIAQVWAAKEECVKSMERGELDEAMLRFVLRFSRWGGFGNNHMRPRRNSRGMGMMRVEKEVEGLLRYWDIYVPSCYREGDGKEYPLVTAIHGFSCNPEYFEQTSDWHRLAEERGFFVVYAAAYPRNAGRSRFPLPGWSVWPMEEEGIDETVYFKVLLEDMETRYPIDRKRIYAVGHSNGGRMVQKLMRAMPEVFAAFVPTGALGGNSPEEIEPIDERIQRPVWFMMGEYDLASPSLEGESTARATLEACCLANHVHPQFENWYDNGNYHTLVMYDETHVPVVQYTIIKGCPHTYTAEMAQLAWDTFLCHFSRREDGSVQYDG